MPRPSSTASLFIGLMSGTSLDGVDGVLAAFDAAGGRIQPLGSAYIPFSQQLRTSLLELQGTGRDEIHREALTANQLARLYADCVAQLLTENGIAAAQVRAIGVHGQTIRHQPDAGYTRQINNPALLAELTNIDVIADFRSRDIAAGGQGAPLVPAFHQAVFGAPGQSRAVVNIGGIANISVLRADGKVLGFDTGPGNVLMDGWIAQHLGQRYDANGDWAAGGRVLPGLLQALREEPFFGMAPPKSTGRDLFHAGWLAERLRAFPEIRPADVQATLSALTASTIADAIATHAADASAIYICGGGARNGHLMQQLGAALAARGMRAPLDSTAALGVPPDQVEALAFAWLAYRFWQRQAGNLPAVTGARGLRILGALYPA